MLDAAWDIYILHVMIGTTTLEMWNLLTRTSVTLIRTRDEGICKPFFFLIKYSINKKC